MAPTPFPALRWLLAGGILAGVAAAYLQPPKPRASAPQRPAPAQAARPAQAPKASAAPKARPDLPVVAATPPQRPIQVAARPIERPRASVQRQFFTATRVKLRARPSAESNVVSILEPDSPVWELARSGPWRLVSMRDNAGWVHGDFLAEPARPKTALSGLTVDALLDRLGSPRRE